MLREVADKNCSTVLNWNTFSSPIKWVCWWTPRVFTVFIVSHTALGWTYRTGLIQRVDGVVVTIIDRWGGVIALGVAMPIYEKHRVTLIKMIVGLTAGLLYDRLEHLVRLIYTRLFCTKKPTSPLSIKEKKIENPILSLSIEQKQPDQTLSKTDE